MIMRKLAGLRSRDVTGAEGTELRDRINLLEDELKFNQVIGRTLEVNQIRVADALKPFDGFRGLFLSVKEIQCNGGVIRLRNIYRRTVSLLGLNQIEDGCREFFSPSALNPKCHGVPAVYLQGPRGLARLVLTI